MPLVTSQTIVSDKGAHEQEVTSDCILMVILYHIISIVHSQKQLALLSPLMALAQLCSLLSRLLSTSFNVLLDLTLRKVLPDRQSTPKHT